MEFDAHYFDGRSSKAHRVRVTLDKEHLLVEGVGHDAGLVPFSVAADDCRVEPPLGSAARIIRLPEGAHLETISEQAVARIARAASSNYLLQIVHLLESRWRFVLVGLLLCAAVSVGSIKYGIPYAAEKIAFAIPPSVTDEMSERAMERLDELFFEESELDDWERERLTKLFSSFAEESGYGAPPRLNFRKSAGGPNAFALPSGIVVMTDAMVELLDEDDQLLGVLAHELAHHSHRHALRKLLQDAGVFLIVSAVVGDASSIASLAATLPVVLVESSYSRSFEHEADDTGAKLMLASGREVAPMVAFMEKVAELQGGGDGSDIISTHPATKKRIARLKKLAEANGETFPDSE